jgi:hypothetical protein
MTTTRKPANGNGRWKLWATTTSAAGVVLLVVLPFYGWIWRLDSRLKRVEVLLETHIDVDERGEVFIAGRVDGIEARLRQAEITVAAMRGERGD